MKKGICVPSCGDGFILTQDHWLVAGYDDDELTMATSARKVEPELMLHSDRGVQYRSGE